MLRLLSVHARGALSEPAPSRSLIDGSGSRPHTQWTWVPRLLPRAFQAQNTGLLVRHQPESPVSPLPPGRPSSFVLRSTRWPSCQSLTLTLRKADINSQS